MLRRTLIPLVVAALLGLTGCQQANQPEPPPGPGPADHPTEVTYFWFREACQHIRTLDHVVVAIEVRAPSNPALRSLARELRRQRQDQVAAYNLYIVKFGGSHPEHAGLPAEIGPTATPFRCGRGLTMLRAISFAIVVFLTWSLAGRLAAVLLAATLLAWWLLRPRRPARGIASYDRPKPTYKAVRTFRTSGGIATTVEQYTQYDYDGSRLGSWYTWTCDCNAEGWLSDGLTLSQARQQAIAHHEAHAR